MAPVIQISWNTTDNVYYFTLLLYAHAFGDYCYLQLLKGGKLEHKIKVVIALCRQMDNEIMGKAM